MKIPAIIDCDPGQDDAMAIFYGARVLDLKGITTVHGNVPLQLTTMNARKIVELAELENIPIAEGFARPLLREPRHAHEVHGRTGLDGPDLPEPTVPILEEHAVDFIYRTAMEVDNFHLLPIGPLTNIAVLLRRYPDVADRIAQISLMGGSLTFGNATAAAEFNIWADPDAARIVFESGIPIKMVGLNVTRQVSATREYRNKCRQLGSRTGIAVAEMLDFYSEKLERMFGLPGGSMHDPLAVSALVDEQTLTFESMHVAVELRGEYTYGMTLCDFRHHKPENLEEGGHLHRGEKPNAEVAVSVDPDRFWDLFLEVLSTYP